MKVKVDDLSKAVNMMLDDYYDEVTRETKNEITEVTKEAHQILVDHAPVSDRKTKGEYKKSLSKRKVSEDYGSISHLLYAKAPHYRLTHLLERGHLTRSGTRTKAYPHFSFASDFIDKELSNRVGTRIKKIKN